MKPKKHTQIQRIKRLENVVSQLYVAVEVLSKKLQKLMPEPEQNPEN